MPHVFSLLNIKELFITIALQVSTKMAPLLLGAPLLLIVLENTLKEQKIGAIVSQPVKVHVMNMHLPVIMENA